MESITPAPQDKEWFPASEWIKRHDSFMACKQAGPIDLLFLGDSITQGWAEEGRAVWDEVFAPLNAVNFGIGGDETQHVLWRVLNGELDDIDPKVVVLMIGTNNLGNSNHSATATLAGVVKVVGTIRAKLPRSKVLLLAIFPRDAEPGTDLRNSIQSINLGLMKLADDQVTYLDLGPKFLNSDGTLSPEIMPDYLHLSPAAYRIWADAIRPTLRQLMRV